MTPKHSLALSAYLQSTKAPWTSLLVVTAGKRAESLVLPPNGFVLKIIKGRQCKTPASLFAEFAQAMKFPDYFGHNWDAMDECLADLEWLPAKGYVLFLRDSAKFWRNHARIAAKLIDAWLTAAEQWSQRGVPFHLIFVW